LAKTKTSKNGLKTKTGLKDYITEVYIFVGSVAESLAATWTRGLKCRFYGDRVITIAWSRFDSHPHRKRCCVLG